jgi:hypothetical protein
MILVIVMMMHFEPLIPQVVMVEVVEEVVEVVVVEEGDQSQ